MMANQEMLLEKMGALEDPDLFIMEYGFLVYKWRVMRFLRAVMDTEVNTHKRTFFDFVKWARDRTGLEEKMIFDQTFIFQMMAGYAPSYSMGGQKIKALQEEMGLAGKDLVRFNTYAASMGFVPGKLFEERLRNFRDIPNSGQ